MEGKGPASGSYPKVHPSDAGEGGAALGRILEAARGVFIERGFHKATISSIARRARASKATLYEHFASKEDLFLRSALAIMDEARRELLPGLVADGPAAARPEDAVDALLQLLPGFVQTCPLFLELWALLARDAALRERCFEAFRDYYRGFAEALTAVLERAAPGAYRAGEAEACALGLIAALDGLCYQWLFMGDRVLLTRVGTAIRETWLRGIRREGP